MRQVGSNTATISALSLLLGEFTVTAVRNVPMNNALAKEGQHPDQLQDAEAQQLWADYSGPWTQWNSVRMVFSMLSTVGFAWALRGGN